MKKILATILSVVLIISVCPFGFFSITASAVTSGTTGECTWSLNGTVLTISGNGVMGNYISMSSTSPWGTLVTKVIIENGVTNIGPCAFKNCSGLMSITVPDSVTRIDNFAFSACNSLTSITIPEGVTSIGTGAFEDCSGLTSITIPEGVTSIGAGTFEDCSGLTSIRIPSSLTIIGSRAFDGCYGLKSVYITDITAWCNLNFNDCYDNPLTCANNLYINNTLVTDLVIPGSITSIGDYAFTGGECLTSITIPEGVEKIGKWAFYGCNGLTNIRIPNSVTSIGNTAFFECYSLTSVIIGNSVTSIGSRAFYGCRSLTNITIPESVTSIGSGAFESCYALRNVTILSKTVPAASFKDCFSIKRIYFSKNISIVYNNAFKNSNNITDIYYEGMEEEWKNVVIQHSNDSFNEAIIHFNSTSLPQYIPGDIDGVEGVTDADAEYMLMYTFFPDDYPVNQTCDFNGDGKVNDADAEHLLMFTFFPEDYPLH